MRIFTLIGVAAATALSLGAVAPAFAETETKVVITDGTVPAHIAIGIPYDYEVWGDASWLVADGAVQFPLEAMQYDGDAVQSTFAMLGEAPEGCVRTVDGFTYGYTLDSYRYDDSSSVLHASGIGTGDPLELTVLGMESIIYSGNSEEYGLDDGRFWVMVPTLEDPQSQSGTVTMMFPEPVQSEEARGYIGFGTPDTSTWIVDYAAFLITDTCTIEVEIPVVDPPVVEPPIVDPPIVDPPVVEPPVVVPPVVDPPIIDPPAAEQPTVIEAAPAPELLAETGTSAGTGALAAAGAFVFGLGLLVAMRRRAHRI